MGELGGLTVLMMVVFLIILTIAWILLPFAMFGTKPLLRELVVEAKRTNALLERLSRGDEWNRVIGQVGGECSASSEQRLYPLEVGNRV